MRLFVTGGTGFIGSHFLNLAIANNHHVVAIRRNEDSKPRIPLAAEPEWLTKSLNNIVESDLEGTDCLVHLASCGVTQSESWETLFQVNVLESLNLWNRAINAGIKKLIICGSCFEYGRSGEHYEFIPVDAPLLPATPYAASKAAASTAAIGLASDKEISITIMRPFHVYGEGEDMCRLWPSLRMAALLGKNYPMTAGQQVRDFVKVEIVACAFLAEATQQNFQFGQALVRNLGSGQPQTVLSFCQTWWKKWNAAGAIQPGAIAYRKNEVLRYVPQL